MSQWTKGEVTAVNSKCNVDVDGTPRHVLDIRKVVLPQCPATASSSEDEVDDCWIERSRSSPSNLDPGAGVGTAQGERRYPQSDRRRPNWYGVQNSCYDQVYIYLYAYEEK